MARGKVFRSAIERGKAKAIKQLTFGADKSAGRNSQGRITIFHRGGGAKRLQRVIDFKRDNPSTGVVERIEYDPNRSSKIALVRWLSGHNNFSQQEQPQGKGFRPPKEILNMKANIGTIFSFSTFNNIMPTKPSVIPTPATAFSPRVLPRVALAGAKPAFFAPLMNESEKLEFSVCDVRRSVDMRPKPELSFSSHGKLMSNPNPNPKKKKLKLKVKVKVDEEKAKAFQADRALVSYILAGRELEAGKTVMNCAQGGLQAAIESNDNRGMSSAYYTLDPQNQAGNCLALEDMRLGTWVHSIEMFPGKGPQLTRSAGTYAKILKKNAEEGHCVVRLPSGREKKLDWKCRATIGMVSNPNHGARKLVKAGQSRWLGRRPVVRGVAMNPIDHPHGGGEGRTKGGRPSVSPWGKPTKSGYKTRSPKKKP